MRPTSAPASKGLGRHTGCLSVSVTASCYSRRRDPDPPWATSRALPQVPILRTLSEERDPSKAPGSPVPRATHPSPHSSAGTSGLGGGVMSRGGESGTSSSCMSWGPKFSLLTASNLGLLTLGAEKTHGRNRGAPPASPPPTPGAPADVLGGRGSSLGTSAASGLFPAPPARLPGGPPGEQRAATSPPAAASSNAGQGRPQGDRPALPAGEKTHSGRPRAAASAPRLAQPTARGPAPPTRPHHGRCRTRLRPPPLLPAALPDSPGGTRRRPAPTFQLGQHLELGRELAVEVVLHAVQLSLVVLHRGRTRRPQLAASRTSRAGSRTSRATARSPAPSVPASPINSRRARRPSPLVSGRGVGGAARAGWAGPNQRTGVKAAGSAALAIGPHGRPSLVWAGRGRGRASALPSERPIPGARHWPGALAGPRRGRGVGGAARAGGAGAARLGGPSRGSRVTGSRGAGTQGLEPGPGSGIGGPDGAARLQVSPGVGGGVGGSQPGSTRDSSACGHKALGTEASAEGVSAWGLSGKERG